MPTVRGAPDGKIVGGGSCSVLVGRGADSLSGGEKESKAEGAGLCPEGGATVNMSPALTGRGTRG